MPKEYQALEIYQVLGKYANVSTYIGGELKAFETELENRFRIEGTISRDNVPREVKGFAMQETIDNKIQTSILLFEYPIQEDNSNTIYHLEGQFQREYHKLDPKKYGKAPVKPNINGPYSGSVNSAASIKVLEEELLSEFKDVPLAEFIFPEIDFDETKNIPLTIGLEIKNSIKIK